MSEIRLRENKKLVEGLKLEEVFRAQGSVGIIDILLGLEEDLRDYQRDVREGKAKPIKEE